MTTQELFDRAQDIYRRALGLVAEIVKHVKDKQSDFDERATYFQFDSLVQFVLLKIALSDGFSEIEGEFIDQITDNYDVLTLYPYCDDEDYDWRFVGAYMSYDYAKTVVNDIEKRVNEHINAFVQLLAEVDFDTGKDYCKQIFECLKDVVSYFILSDGNKTKQEMEMAVEVVSEWLTIPYFNLLNKLKNS